MSELQYGLLENLLLSQIIVVSSMQLRNSETVPPKLTLPATFTHFSVLHLDLYDKVARMSNRHATTKPPLTHMILNITFCISDISLGMMKKHAEKRGYQWCSESVEPHQVPSPVWWPLALQVFLTAFAGAKLKDSCRIQNCQTHRFILRNLL